MKKIIKLIGCIICVYLTIYIMIDLVLPESWIPTYQPIRSFAMIPVVITGFLWGSYSRELK